MVEDRQTDMGATGRCVWPGPGLRAGRVPATALGLALGFLASGAEAQWGLGPDWRVPLEPAPAPAPAPGPEVAPPITMPAPVGGPVASPEDRARPVSTLDQTHANAAMLDGFLSALTLGEVGLPMLDALDAARITQALLRGDGREAVEMTVDILIGKGIQLAAGATVAGVVAGRFRHPRRLHSGSDLGRARYRPRYAGG